MGVLGRDSMSDVTQRKNILPIKLPKGTKPILWPFYSHSRQHFVGIFPIIFEHFTGILRDICRVILRALCGIYADTIIVILRSFVDMYAGIFVGIYTITINGILACIFSGIFIGVFSAFCGYLKTSLDAF